MDWKTIVLEELIYERIRVHVDLLELLDFERDLNESIGRAMREVGGAGDDAEALARQYLDRAWRRVEEEWRSEREADDEECPLCAGPFECPPPASG
jgi:hypothetical protein